GADWSRCGHRSPESWLAEKTGVGFRDAQNTLEGSHKLKDLPKLNEAVRAGVLSAPALNELATAATPQNESRLLHAAATENVGTFRRTCAQEKAAQRCAEDEARRAARIHR